MTMTYLGLVAKSQDEMKVLQQISGGENICIFRGNLHPGGDVTNDTTNLNVLFFACSSLSYPIMDFTYVLLKEDNASTLWASLSIAACVENIMVCVICMCLNRSSYSHVSFVILLVYMVNSWLCKGIFFGSRLNRLSAISRGGDQTIQVFGWFIHPSHQMVCFTAETPAFYYSRETRDFKWCLKLMLIAFFLQTIMPGIAVHSGHSKDPSYCMVEPVQMVLHDCGLLSFAGGL